MAANIVFAICIAISCIQSISAQCKGTVFPDELALAGVPLSYLGLAGNGRNYGTNPINTNGYPTTGSGIVASATGGGFAVTSKSQISPTGITVVSENIIEGPLTVVGELPFLGAVALDGKLLTNGIGSVSYGCGSNTIGIMTDSVSPGIQASSSSNRFGTSNPSAGCNSPGFGYYGY